MKTEYKFTMEMKRDPDGTVKYRMIDQDGKQHGREFDCPEEAREVLGDHARYLHSFHPDAAKP